MKIFVEGCSRWSYQAGRWNAKEKIYGCGERGYEDS